MLRNILIFIILSLPLYASAGINFYLTQQRASDPHVDNRFAKMTAVKLNNAHIVYLYASEGASDTDDTYGSLFAWDPAGVYNVTVYCSDNHNAQADRGPTSSIIKRFTLRDGDALFANVTCQYDKTGHMNLPVVDFVLQHRDGSEKLKRIIPL